MINPDLTPEERQGEFINLMKERFVDGKDPDYGMEKNCFRKIHIFWAKIDRSHNIFLGNFRVFFLQIFVPKN